MSVDRNSPMPLYYQIKRLLLAKIESGELQAGDAFPTEQQIQAMYEVSRTTVRQALSELEDEGKITRHRGRGTFVAEAKVSHSPDQYPDLADHMARQGLSPGWRLLSMEWVVPPEEIATQLKLEFTQKVYKIERLRLADGREIGHQLAYVAPQYAGVIDESALLDGGSLRYLRGLSVLEECVADRVLEAIPATRRIANYLKIAEGTPVLRIRRVVHTPDGKPIEAFLGIYRGDRFEYHINNMRAISNINA